MKKVVAILLALAMMTAFASSAFAINCGNCENPDCKADCACIEGECEGDCCKEKESNLPDFLQAIVDFFTQNLIEQIRGLIQKIMDSIKGPAPF